LSDNTDPSGRFGSGGFSARGMDAGVARYMWGWKVKCCPSSSQQQ
jgi:hypothetical protein